MNDLTGLLEKIEHGRIPPEVISKRNGKPRIGLIDDALKKVRDDLKSVAGSISQSGNSYDIVTPFQPEEVEKRFEPYLEVLNTAREIVSALYHGRIRYTGERVVPDSLLGYSGVIKLEGRLWPKGRRKLERLRVPHLRTINELREMIYAAIEGAGEGYRKWQIKNKVMRTAIEGELEKAEDLSKKAEGLYKRLQGAYFSLQEGIETGGDGWLDKAAGKIGYGSCSDIGSLISRFEESEISVRELTKKAKEICLDVGVRLNEQLALQETGSYTLTKEDIGKKGRKGTGTGLLGELRRVEVNLSWYKEPSAKQTTLFENGVTVRTRENDSMMDALQDIIGLGPFLIGAERYADELSTVKTNLSHGNFSLPYQQVHFDPEQGEREVESVLHEKYPALSEHYAQRFAGFDRLIMGVQVAYDRACTVLKKRAEKYLDTNIRVDSEDKLSSFKNDLGEVCDAIVKARAFQYCKITPSEVVSDGQLHELEKFRGIIGSTESFINNLSVTPYLERFKEQMGRAESERIYGAHDPDFRDATIQARGILVQMNQQSGTPQKSVDPRVAPIFKKVKDRAVPPVLVEQLKEYEHEISMSRYIW